MGRTGKRARARSRVVVALISLLGLTLAATAWAHVERPAYFPDPAPDTSVKPPAGGGVPVHRTLASGQPRTKLARLILKAPRAIFKAGRAYKAKAGAGNVRVVCQPGSLTAARQAIVKAHDDGYRYRPTEALRKLTNAQVHELRRLNTLFFRLCGYREIQPAVTASGNNDRVVVMPGVYTEPTARAKPTHDPACKQYQLPNGDRPEEPGALSYAYQFHCPNDQNLVAVMGQTPGPGADPSPPREDRNGIPNTGRCIRCNFQIEGSVPTADDTVLEAGKAEVGNGGPSGIGHAKDVGIRADRADGFVLRDMTVRHASEHNIYVMESDGYLLERFKTFYPGLYGVLTFVEDHGIIQNCEAVGGGDSGLYPGAPAETGEQRPAGTAFRYNQQVRFCDMHHNLAGYSATDGNAVHVHHNKVYDNALGIGTDVATAAGHPGFPGDSSLFENNDIYSNNFNLYAPGSDVKAAFPYPVGTGLWIAGGNNHTVRNNRFYDNWRRGTMLFAVPDALVCGPAAGGNEQAGCSAGSTSTSHRNRFYGNVMGIAPDGTRKPNGIDFWWDNFAGNKANCWYDNRGAAPIRTSPARLPDCDGGRNPDSSVGTGDPANEAELGICAIPFVAGENPGDCPWFHSPPKPGTAAARAANSPAQRARMAAAFSRFCREAGPVPTCTGSASGSQ